MKKSVLALLLSVLLVCGFVMQVCAETVVRDGIEVTLTTDKESYDSLDVIDARLTVRNTNSFGVENVSAQITAPAGYVLSEDGEAKIGELSAGEVQIQQASVHDVEVSAPELPQTGDDSDGMLWSLLLFASVAALSALVIRNPKAKRIISLFLCVAMVGTMVLNAVPVLAAESGQDANITVSKKVIVDGKQVELTGSVKYAKTATLARMRATETPASEFTYYDAGTGEITIKAYKGNLTDIVVPSHIEGKPVAYIGDGYYYSIFSNPSMIKSVVLPDTVKRIEANAFSMCTNLESVVFPNGGLEFIGGEAFVGCDSLKEVDIYASGDLDVAIDVNDNGGAFAQCDSLESVSIVCDGSLNMAGQANFNECASLKEVVITGKKGLIIGDRAFWNCEALETVVFDSDGVVQLNDYALRGCSMLTSVMLPETTIQMGQSVFSYCMELAELHMPKGIESINDPSYLMFMYTGYNAGGLTVYGYNGSYIQTYIEEYNRKINQDEEYPVKFVGSEYTCTHSKGNFTYEQDNTVAPKYTDNGDGLTHLVQPILNKYCVDCGTYVGDIVGNGTSYEHTITDGVCLLCGYEQECEHEPVALEYVKHIFEPIAGDNMNHRVAGVVYEATCGRCKTEYEITYRDVDIATGETFPRNAMHDAWNKGVCGTCGYECAHTFETMKDAAGDPKAEPNSGIWASQGAMGHKCTSIKYWHKCTNCGLEETYEKKNPYGDEVQEHMMNNVLKAHYDYDANEHWLVGEDKKCTAIGCGYEDYVPVDNAPHNLHQFSNGYCVVCGMADPNYSGDESDHTSGYEESGSVDNDVYDVYFKNYCEIVMNNNKVNVIVSMLPWEINGYIYDLAKFDFFGLGDRISEAINDPESELLYEGILKSLTDNSQDDTVTDNVLTVADLGYKVTKNTWKGYKLGVNAVLQALGGEQFPAELAKVDSYLSRFGYGLSVAKELDQSWDNVMLLAEVAGQYSEKLDFLDNCIEESEGKLKVVYQRIRDELEIQYNDSFASLKNFVNQNPEKVLFSFSTMKVVLDMNGVRVDKAVANAMKNLAAKQAEQAAIKSGKNLGEAIKAGEKAYSNTNALLIAHGITVLAADEVFSGDDIYKLAPQIRREERNLDEMLGNLRSNYDEYVINPTRNNALQLKNEVIMYAKYMIGVLETCDKYLDCIVNTDIREDGKVHVKDGISTLNKSINRIEEAYSKMLFKN